MLDFFMQPKPSLKALSYIEKESLRYFALLPVRQIAAINVEDALQTTKEYAHPTEFFLSKFNTRAFWENVGFGLRLLVSKFRPNSISEGTDLKKTLDGLVRKKWLVSETEGTYARTFEVNPKTKSELGLNPKKCFPVIDSYLEYMRFGSEFEAAYSMLYLDDAVSILSVLDDYSDLDTGRLCAKVALAYASQKDFKKAVKYQEKNIHIFESNRNYSEEELSFSYYFLSLFNYHIGDYPASKFYIDIALNLITKALPPSAPDVKKFIQFKNNVYKACNKDRESEY